MKSRYMLITKYIFSCNWILAANVLERFRSKEWKRKRLRERDGKQRESRAWLACGARVLRHICPGGCSVLAWLPLPARRMGQCGGGISEQNGDDDFPPQGGLGSPVANHFSFANYTRECADVQHFRLNGCFARSM